jgi:hypothetical protein
LAALESAQLRLRIVVVALAFSPLLVGALLPLLSRSGEHTPDSLAVIRYVAWGFTALLGAAVVLWPEAPPSLPAEAAVRQVVWQGLLAEGPALLAMVMYYLGVALVDCAGLFIVALLLFAMLATRISKLGAAVQQHMLEEFALTHPPHPESPSPFA